MAELLAAPLHDLDLVALMIDGVHFGEHLCVVALGIDIDGTNTNCIESMISIARTHSSNVKNRQTPPWPCADARPG